MKLFARAALAVILLFGFAGPSFAAVTANSVITIQTPKAPKVQIVNANGTTAQTFYAGGTNGSKIWAIVGTNTDSGAAYGVQLSILRSATTYVLCTVNVPLSAGNTTAAPAINLISAANCPGLPVDSDGNPFLFLESTDTLQAATLTTVTSAKAVSLMAVGGDF